MKIAKRILSLMLGCLFTLATFFTPIQVSHAMASTPVNLIPNPGFESGSLSPWTSQNDASVVANNAHSGTYAADLGTVYSGVQQTITGLSPNTQYLLTAWVKTAGDAIYLGAENYAGSGSQINTVTTSSTYTQLSITFTTDASTTSAYIFVYKNDNTGSAYADDFSLTAVNQVDKSALNSEIGIAQGLSQNAVVGTSPGDCLQSDLDALNAAIASAQSVANDSTADQGTVDSATSSLTNEVTSFEATGVQLIPNPGFETSSLSPWTTQNNATVEADNAHSGTYAANLGGTGSGIQQTITGLSPNTSYTLTAWVKTPGDVVYLGAKNFAGSGTEVNATTSSSSYTQVSVTFETDSTTTSAYIFLWKQNDSGPAYADDLSLTVNYPYSTKKYNENNVGFNTQDPFFQTTDSLNQLYNQVQGTGTKWVRATLFWDLMEPTQGTIDWTQADMIFNAVQSHGFKLDLVIRSAPSWANGGYSTPNHNYAPDDPTSYGTFCYQVAKRYLNRGVNIVFELGNEENTHGFNMPAVDPVQYTNDMLIPGTNGIRQAGSELGVGAPTILVGGFAPVDPQYVPGSMTPLDFLQAIYNNGGKGYFDSIAYHPYTYVSPPSPSHWTFTELQSLVNLMNSEGDTNRLIYATEVGWATGTGNGEVSEAMQSGFTGQVFDQWFGLPYAGPMIWYELVDNQSYDNTNRENTFGLMYSTSPWTPKPVYSTFLFKIQAPTNLIPNPGFESGSLAPWTTQNDATVVTGNAHSGQYAANLGSSSTGVQQTITGLSPNTTYTLTAWIKTQGDVVYLGAKNFAGSGSEVNTVTTSPNYTQLSVTFTTAANTTSAYIFTWKQDNTGTAYADDFSLTADD